MSHITFPVDPEGMLFDVMVGLTGKDTLTLATAGQPIPRPLLLRGDNGRSR
jgi:hypothetical protein